MDVKMLFSSTLQNNAMHFDNLSLPTHGGVISPLAETSMFFNQKQDYL
jgi:hypothetical protein